MAVGILMISGDGEKAEVVREERSAGIRCVKNNLRVASILLDGKKREEARAGSRSTNVIIYRLRLVLVCMVRVHCQSRNIKSKREFCGRADMI